MSIEEAIQQKKPFRNEWQRAIVNLFFTSNWIRDKNKKLLKQYDLTIQQYNALRILRGAGKPISTSVIRERLLDKMADTSRLVERLANKGLVKRRPCAEDKRLVDVSLSKQGILLMKNMDSMNQEMDEAMNGLTEEEAKIFNNLLDKVRKG